MAASEETFGQNPSMTKKRYSYFSCESTGKQNEEDASSSNKSHREEVKSNSSAGRTFQIDRSNQALRSHEAYALNIKPMEKCDGSQMLVKKKAEEKKCFDVFLDRDVSQELEPISEKSDESSNYIKSHEVNFAELNKAKVPYQRDFLHEKSKKDYCKIMNKAKESLKGQNKS